MSTTSERRSGPEDLSASRREPSDPAQQAALLAGRADAGQWARDTVTGPAADAGSPTPATAPAASCAAADRGPLEHLQPDRLRIGGVGVFADDWAWLRDAHGRDRARVAFVGVLVDRSNGWAVFSCTRPVAEAIVADQNGQREIERTRLATHGASGPELDTTLDQLVPPIWFDGDDILVDRSATYSEDRDAAIERIRPDEHGRYIVLAGSGCWSAVDPGVCDRIEGDLPAPAEQQQYVAFTHVAGMVAPHDRLQVTALHQRRTRDGVTCTADLSLDGGPAGTIVDRRGECAGWTPTGAGFSDADLHEYVAGCRRNGQAMTVDEVLAALITEHDLGRRANAADAAGRALIRAVDDDGTVQELLSVAAVRPGRRGTREALRRLAAARPPQSGAAHWEVWGGSAWHYLQRVAPATRARNPQPETRH